MPEAADPVALQSAHDSAADFFPVETFRAGAAPGEGRGATIGVTAFAGASTIGMGARGWGTMIPSGHVQKGRVPECGGRLSIPTRRPFRTPFRLPVFGNNSDDTLTSWWVTWRGLWTSEEFVLEPRRFLEPAVGVGTKEPVVQVTLETVEMFA
jgi:hypothetical protein